MGAWAFARPVAAVKHPEPTGLWTADGAELPVDPTGVLAVVDRDRIRASIDDLWTIKLTVVYSPPRVLAPAADRTTSWLGLASAPPHNSLSTCRGTVVGETDVGDAHGTVEKAHASVAGAACAAFGV